MCAFAYFTLAINANLGRGSGGNDRQFIIHCCKLQQRQHLIEFVLFLEAGCPSKKRVGGGWVLSQAIPVQRGVRGAERGCMEESFFMFFKLCYHYNVVICQMFNAFSILLFLVQCLGFLHVPICIFCNKG